MKNIKAKNLNLSILLLKIFFGLMSVVLEVEALNKPRNNFQPPETSVAVCGIPHDSKNNLENSKNEIDSLTRFYYSKLLIKYNACFDFIEKMSVYSPVRPQIFVENSINEALTSAKQLKIILLHFNNEKKFQTDLKVFPSLKTVANNEYFFATGKRISICFPDNNLFALRGGGNKASQLVKLRSDIISSQQSTPAANPVLSSALSSTNPTTCFSFTRSSRKSGIGPMSAQRTSPRQPQYDASASRVPVSSLTALSVTSPISQFGSLSTTSFGQSFLSSTPVRSCIIYL